jgi:hypothetical protein
MDAPIMITVRQLARAKHDASASQRPESMGPYDHQARRRWVGDDASLISWTMKSDTMHDGESKDPDPEFV